MSDSESNLPDWKTLGCLFQRCLNPGPSNDGRGKSYPWNHFSWVDVFYLYHTQMLLGESILCSGREPFSEELPSCSVAPSNGIALLPVLVASRCLLGQHTSYRGASCMLKPWTPSHFLAWLVKHCGVGDLAHHTSSLLYPTHSLSSVCHLENSSTVLGRSRGNSSGCFWPAIFHVISICPEVELLSLPAPRPPLYLQALRGQESSMLEGGSIRLNEAYNRKASGRLPSRMTEVETRRSGFIFCSTSQFAGSKRNLFGTPVLYTTPPNLKTRIDREIGRFSSNQLSLYSISAHSKRSVPPKAFSSDISSLLSLNGQSSFSCSPHPSLISGVFLKARSPSCGIGDARMYLHGCSPSSNNRPRRINGHNSKNELYACSNGFFTTILLSKLRNDSIIHRTRGSSGWRTQSNTNRNSLPVSLATEKTLKYFFTTKDLDSLHRPSDGIGVNSIFTTPDSLLSYLRSVLLHHMWLDT